MKPLAILIISYFLGLMIASAGMSVYAELARPTAHFVCPDGEFTIETQNYSYKPGQSGKMTNIYCVNAMGEKKDVVFKVFLYGMFIYGTLCLLPVSLILKGLDLYYKAKSR